jgi:hypothetical protein
MSGMARRPRYDAVLDAHDLVEGRPFSDPPHTHADVAVMGGLLRRQREIARAWAEDGAPPFASLRTGGDDEPRQWLAVPDTKALVGVRDVTAVGFFGSARENDHSVLFALEDQVVQAFPDFAAAGLLSYFDRELDDGSHGFGNLILFATPDVPPEWFANSAHERAVSLSPEYYHSIRLHKGTIPGPFLGEREVQIERTKYFDFDSDPAWRGLRVFASE